MNKTNYDKIMQAEIEFNSALGKKPKLLLHACCAPCSSACIERLINDFDITVYFYNPNIDGGYEYEHRRAELKRLTDAFGVNLISAEYNPQEFYEFVIGLEKEKEGGARCEKCFLLRLNSTAKYAVKNGFDYFATTLTVSPLKNEQVINDVGLKVQQKIGGGIKYLPSDFKKRNGYKRSIELSNEYNLYRQNYCGCVFSKAKND